MEITGYMYFTQLQQLFGRMPQRIELQKHRGASRKGCSVFRNLLNLLADDITNLDTKQKNEIIWSLDKIQEFNHRLY